MAMTKLWIAVEHYYDTYDIHGVFDSRERAIAGCPINNPHWISIYSCVLNQGYPVIRVYSGPEGIEGDNDHHEPSDEEIIAARKACGVEYEPENYKIDYGYKEETEAEKKEREERLKPRDEEAYLTGCDYIYSEKHHAFGLNVRFKSESGGYSDFCPKKSRDKFNNIIKTIFKYIYPNLEKAAVKDLNKLTPDDFTNVLVNLHITDNRLADWSFIRIQRKAVFHEELSL